MIVVVAIVLVILGLILPAASTLWNERKTAQAVNAVQGLLMTSRAKAMEADGVESGFLAFVDEEGAHHCVSITQASPSKEELANLNPLECAKLRRAYAIVFEITDDRDQVLPKPMRVVPQYVVDVPTTADSDPDTFSGLELANNDFQIPPDDVDEVQRHRNFFTMVFSTDGHLLVNCDVLIQDEDQNGDGIGDRTGLRVGPGPPHNSATTTQYYTISGDATNIDPEPNPKEIPFLVTDEDDVAINFPSVDGLMVYDDSLFNEVTTPEKRSFLLRVGQPLYVSRWTGTVIRGPVGESEAP